MSIPPGVFLALREPEDARFYPSVIPVQSYAPSSSARVWLDTSTVPPTLKGWNGAAWVLIGGTGVLNQTELTTHDLDTIKSPGFYIQSDTAEATLARHYPVASLNGHIAVESAGGASPARVVQTFTASSTTTAGARRFWRTFASPTWSPWVELAAPEVVRDTMAAALVAGTGVSITPNDGADTITIAASGSGSTAIGGAQPASGWWLNTDGVDPPEPDVTAPSPGTLSSSGIGGSSFTLTVTGASDETALHAQPYRFSTDNGSSWSAWQTSNTYVASASPTTTYNCLHQVRDTSGNTATGVGIPVTTTAGPPFTPVGSTMLTSDSFSGAAVAAGGRATDIAHGGSAVTPTETVASTFDLDGAGNLAVGGTGRLMYAIATANPDVYFGLRIVTPPVESTSIRLRTGSSGSAAVSLQLKDITGARKADLLIGGVSAGTFTIAAGDDVGVSAKGATVQAYLNGTVMASGTATVETGANHAIVAATVTQGNYFSDLVIAAI